MQMVTQRVLPGITVLLAAYYIVHGFVALAAADYDSTGERVLFSLAGVFAGAMILGGLLIMGRYPWAGVGLLAAGAIFMTGLWYWMIPILGPVTLVVVAFGILRARSLARERRAAGSLTSRPS